MTVFAQICATHAVVTHIGGSQNPALVAPEDMGALIPGWRNPLWRLSTLRLYGSRLTTTTPVAP